MPLEVAVFSVEDAIQASTSGADRVEICTDYPAGGLTMPLRDLSLIRQHWRDNNIATPMYAMIRPAPGSFHYDAASFDRMRAEIRERLGLCDGFVFGILSGAEGAAVVDERHCRELVELAAGLPCTFHRAVDETADPLEALDVIRRCGFENVLSSGGAGTAAEGASVLREMVARGVEARVTVVAGGGVRHGNAGTLVKETAVRWVHTAARVNDRMSLDEIKNITSTI